jgi:hypothetical protein
MQPDPTTPALTALAQAAAREHTGLALGNLLHVHCAVCDLLHEFIPRDEPLAAQQPDERVAGLVEAARAIHTTQVYEVPGSPERGLNVGFVRAMRLLAEARERCEAALAAQQPDERVAGLVEALRTIVGRWDRADIKWEPDRPHWHSIHRQGYDRLEDAINRARSLLAQPPAAGGAAGERCAFVSQWGPCGETTWGMNHSHTVTCRHPAGHPEFASCHRFTPPAAPAP